VNPPKFDVPQLIILSRQRSGTHFLESCVASHPKVRGRGECFIRYKKRLLGIITPNDIPRRDWVVFENQVDRLNIGILMYDHVPFFELHFGPLRDHKIIHLLRNPVAIANSEAQKLANREYYKEGYASHYRINQTPPPNRPFDPRLAEEMCRAIRQDQTIFAERLTTYPRVLTITYESITGNCHASNILQTAAETLLNFLNLEPHPLSTTLQKTGVFLGLPIAH